MMESRWDSTAVFALRASSLREASHAPGVALRACLENGVERAPVPVGDSPTGMAAANLPEPAIFGPGGQSPPFRPASRRTAQASGLCHPGIFQTGSKLSSVGPSAL